MSSEQECKKTEQKVQELTAKKDRIEKFIANILNGEGYSKLKAIAKENVKAALSEKRLLISISFAAVIQTLKDDPQIVKLIYNIASANNGKQHKNNNNNIANYFKANKHTLLDLAEKHYENLVEVLTNNAITTATDSSSNFISSLPQSSSTFPNAFDQINTYKIEEPDTHHNSNGNIVE